MQARVALSTWFVMNRCALRHLVACFLLLIVSFSLSLSKENDLAHKDWPGYSILGNGRLCVVYSDDDRIPRGIIREGIRHLYYLSFEADYINKTSFDILDASGGLLEKDSSRKTSVDMANLCTARSKTYLNSVTYPPDRVKSQNVDNSEIDVVVECRVVVHPNDAVVLKYEVTGADEGSEYVFRTGLNNRIVTDTVTELMRAEARGSDALFEWSNGTTIMVGSLSGSGGVSIEGNMLGIGGPLRNEPVQIVIAIGESEAEAMKKLSDIRTEESPQITAYAHWVSWIRSGVVPDFGDDELYEAYSRNLYAAKASCIKGQIPADVTGQFVTNGMPQLYPRDALMTARVFILTGHLEEARDVLEFWAHPRIPRKSPGEWYARYDAHGNAVDAGSGARYDEPEWDSNGYFIILANQYFEATGEWPVHPKRIIELADFLVEHIDENGLLYEGGIIEWTGYLPATNMVASAALRVFANMILDPKLLARPDWPHRCQSYHNASIRIATALRRNQIGSSRLRQSTEPSGPSLQVYDDERETYTDVRFAGAKGADNLSLADKTGEKLYLWDTSANFGVIWGYPDHEQMERTNEFYAENCVKLGGGMQYFDSPDPGLAGYGHDVFFFTTAAAAQYHALYGDRNRSKMHIDWMLENANSYGLMPERIYLDQSGCSSASPLSWCCAEFVAALLEYNNSTIE